MNVYSTRTEVDAEIASAIEQDGNATAAEFDTDAIATDCYAWSDDKQGFVPVASPEEFWQSVERNALAALDLTFIEGTEDDQEAEGNAVGKMRVSGHNGDEVEIVTYSTTSPEEWEPEIYTEALNARGFTVAHLTPAGGYVRRYA